MLLYTNKQLVPERVFPSPTALCLVSGGCSHLMSSDVGLEEGVILAELSLCYSCAAFQRCTVIRAVLSGWSTESGFDLIGPSSQSFKHLCIFGLYGAM